MKQFVDINIEIVVGVAISFLVRGSLIQNPRTRTDQVVRRSSRIQGDFFFSIHPIYHNHTIFYIEEKVSQQAAACSDS